MFTQNAIIVLTKILQNVTNMCIFLAILLVLVLVLSTFALVACNIDDGGNDNTYYNSSNVLKQFV